ncbi:MAG: SDR family oxidoreductase [Candidatus Poseidoniales archaeon]|nr:SDR family oxidoreductase [Candidatus Poseidoniales archaeon]
MATWVITGANRGLGLEFVKQLLASGHQIIAGVRQIDSVPIRHEDLTVFALDVSSGDSVNQFADQVKTITNQIDVLVNNAGRMDGRWQSLDEVDPEISLEVMNVNTIGPLRVSQALWPLLQGPTLTKVANISSLMGSIEDCMSGRSYAYRTSKTGLNMISKVLAVEGQKDNITVTAYHPGWAKTDMGGERAPVPVSNSVRGLIELINNQETEKTGRFFEYTGEELPW